MSGVVLTVDDAKAVRQMVRFSLEAEGYEVIEAENGQDALNKLSGVSPKLIIADLNMPVMNGLELIEAVRASGSSVPIVMLTTESNPEMKAKGKSAGATGWINKPFDEAMLISVAKKLAG